MGIIPRSILFLALCAALSSCSQTPQITAYRIDGPLCSDCPTQLTIDTSGTVTDATDPEHPERYRLDDLGRQLLATFPDDEFRYAQTHAVVSAGDVGVPVTTIDAKGGEQTAVVPIGMTAGAPKEAWKLQRWMSVVAERGMSPRSRDVYNSVIKHSLKAVELQVLGCFGSCAAYDAHFRNNGTASIHVFRACGGASDARAHIDFQRITAYAYLAAQLRPKYEIRAVDTLGARLLVSTPHTTYTSFGPDSTTWGRNFSALVARYDQLVRDTSWEPAVTLDCKTALHR